MSSVCDFFSFFFNLGAEEWKLEKVLVEKKNSLSDSSDMQSAVFQLAWVYF